MRLQLVTRDDGDEIKLIGTTKSAYIEESDGHWSITYFNDGEKAEPMSMPDRASAIEYALGLLTGGAKATV